ncbi:MAG: alpha-L-fucosidase, partial [candidate division KSB1 bacterium]|nr:alpha-L-fucosidase [candidate division KSB1 bacterium]
MKKTCALFLLLVTSLSAKEWSETPEQKAQRMQWWTEARFGMFIHGRLYAMAARHEWVKSHERITN